MRTPAEKKAWRIGLAAADPGICLLSAGRECTACVTACPHGAISVESDGFDTALRIDADGCNGCGACETVCELPADAMAATANPAGRCFMRPIERTNAIAVGVAHPATAPGANASLQSKSPSGSASRSDSDSDFDPASGGRRPVASGRRVVATLPLGVARGLTHGDGG